jgi:rhodanese-related sulfurtransferase
MKPFASDDLIRPAELNQKIRDDELPPVVVDVRPLEDYRESHIPGAANIPEGEILRSLKNLDQKRPVVTYCDMRHPGSSRSESAARKLRKAGIQARALEGGLPAWEEAGFPVHRVEHFKRVGKV